MLPVILPMVMQYMQQQQAQREQRKQAAAGMLQRNAASLGAPTYNVEAAQLLGQQQGQRRTQAADVLGQIMQRYGGTGGGAGGAQPQPSATDQDYLNNPYTGGRGRY